MPSRPKSNSPKKRAQSKSPARSTRSRSRSRGRSKSPARKPRTQSKSPSRRSPARKAKAEVVEKVVEKQVKEVIEQVQDAVKQTSSSRSSRKEQISQSGAVTVTKTTTQESTTAVLRSSASTPTRQSARIASLNADKDTTDSSKEVKQVSTRTKKEGEKEWAMGGPVATAVMTVLFPLLVFLLNFACTKESCSGKSLLNPIKIFPQTLASYMDKESFLMLGGFHAFIAIFSALPIGKEVYGPPLKGGRRLKFRMNGVFLLVLSTTTFATLWYLDMGVTLIYKKFYQLMTISVLHAFVFSFALFARSTKAPSADIASTGNTGCLSHDFFMGRELHPRIGSINLKLLMAHIGLIAVFLINLSFLAVSYEQKKSIDYTLLAAVIFQNTCLLDNIVYEEAMMSTVEMVKHGLGFMNVFYLEAMVPFTLTLTTRYLLEHPQAWSCWALMAFTFFHLSGYVIYRGSNLQKNNFRKNPNDPAFANMETIPTSSGKKLLVSGWWGLVRHPNYLGDLIMSITWSALCGCGSWIVYYYPISLLFTLIDRSNKDGQWCKEKHGAAWDRYCQRVKYQILPRVY